METEQNLKTHNISVNLSGRVAYVCTVHMLFSVIHVILSSEIPKKYYKVSGSCVGRVF